MSEDLHIIRAAILALGHEAEHEWRGRVNTTDVLLDAHAHSVHIARQAEEAPAGEEHARTFMREGRRRRRRPRLALLIAVLFHL